MAPKSSSAKAKGAMKRLRQESVGDRSADASASSSHALASHVTPKKRTRSDMAAPSERPAKAKRAEAASSSSAIAASSASAGSSPSGRDTPRRSRSDPDATGEQTIEAGKICSSCWRAFGVGHAWLMPNSDLVWLYPGGRGQSCRDCSNYYRIAFKPHMPGGVYEVWMSSAEHRAEWLRYLVGYLSLKKDGCQLVTKQLLASRMQMLDWVFGLLGVPWPLFEVCEADEAYLRRLSSDPRAGAYLLPSASRKMFGLQRRLPSEDAPATSARFVTAVQAAKVWPLQSMNTLPADFVNTWSSGVGDRGYRGIAADTGEGPEENPIVSAPTGPSTKVSKQRGSNTLKVQSLCESAKILVQTLARNIGASEATSVAC